MRRVERPLGHAVTQENSANAHSKGIEKADCSSLMGYGADCASGVNAGST
jgi:uncharacterized protein YaaN involved in tellurite resistance